MTRPDDSGVLLATLSERIDARLFGVGEAYLRTVTAAFPECAGGFTALTRAYEDVRYGGETLPKSAIARLDASRQMTMAGLRRAKPIEEEGP